MKIEELEKNLKQGNLQGLYLLYGEEQFLLESALKRIKSLFGELLKGINYVVIDEKNIQEMISNIETPAFGFEKKLIIAKDTGLFKKESKKKNKSNEGNIKEKINLYISENIEVINSSCVIIFVETEVEKCELYKTIERLGIVCEFEFQKKNNIEARLKAICNAYKVNIDNYVLSYFVESCGTSMQELVNELRKLIEYTGENGKITKEDIDQMATKKIESVVFDLTDSLGKKNVKQALVVLKNLILVKEPVQKILITLYNHFKKLYLVKIATQTSRDVALSLSLKPNQMFLVSKYKAQANLFNTQDLRRILKELCDLDYKYKIRTNRFRDWI